jgi:hypothetical protein
VLGTFDAGDQPAGGGGATRTAGTGAAGSIAPGSAGTAPSPTGAAGTSTSGAGGTAGIPVVAGPLGPSESWTGYVENHTFPSGSDVLKLTFATDSKGVAVGTIVFGQGTPPAKATDPNVGYPPDLVSSSQPKGPGVALGPGVAQQYVAEGFPYPFDDGALAAHRLQFKANLSQLWASWCALQTPPVDGSSGCVPNWGGGEDSTGCFLQNPQTKANVKVDCGKLFLCMIASPCECGATGCGVTTQNVAIAAFDVFLSGDTASGSVQATFGNNNVHFVKD